MKLLYKFYFKDGVDMSRVEAQLIESFMTSVDIFGESEMKLSATYLVTGQETVLEVSRIAGLHTLLVFVGRLSRLIGVDQYSMNPMERSGIAV